MLARIEAFRSADGGYATHAGCGARHARTAAFLALGAYQDFGRAVAVRRRAVLDSLRGLRAADGSYGNYPGLPSGVTPTTAAAVIVMRHLGATADRERRHVAARSLPRPRRILRVGGRRRCRTCSRPRRRCTRCRRCTCRLAGLREPCLDFVDSLWTNRGGFFGTWADDSLDCEYTYYALLALGHLSLEPS